MIGPSAAATAVGSSRRLTDEQAAALAVVGSSVALSAGAGCGKTTVLTERFVLALDGPDPVPLARLVALTFTNKAARELRDRIRRECRQRLVQAGDGSQGADPTYWRGVVRGLAAARIGTFHSFCGEVLRRHAVEAGVDPAYAVLDEPVAAALRDEALSLALRDALAHRDADLIELAVEFGLGAVRTALGHLLANRSGGDIATWTDRTPEGLLGHWLDRWMADVRPALLDRVRSSCTPTLDQLSRTPPDHPKTLARVADLRAAVAALDLAGEPVPLVQAVREPATVVGLTGKGCWPNAEIYEAVRDGFKAIRETCDKVIQALAWDEATSLLAASQGLRLARLASRARATYDRLKRQRGAVDQDDLLILTRDLVTGDAPAVRSALSESADLILVDEFQDTDPVQAEILRAMVGSDEAAAQSGRLFLVGDSKQSIYRFRGADPRLFGRFRAGVAEAGRRDLTANFRSVPGILHFVNALFATSFADNPPLRPGTRPGEAPPPDEGPPAVIFTWDVPPEPSTDQAAPSAGRRSRVERPDVDARRGDEARRLARLLADRLRDGWLIRDPDQPGHHRKARPGDVAILFRTLADSPTFERALADEGLDFLVVGGSGFFAQQEVRDLANVLAAVEDPTDSIALAGALRSPFFGVSDDALFWLSVEVPTALHAGLDRMEGAKLDRLPPADRPRVARARTLLAAWRDRKDAVPIATLVDQILQESGYEASLLGESLGDRKRANARKLVRLARRFDEAGGFTLAEYVDRLRSDLKAATKENQAATTDSTGQAVRLMSIHQSKGLEFPIVVVPDLDRRRPGERRRIAFDADLGPLVNPVADPDDGADLAADDEPTGSLGWSVYRALDAQADEAEALRLLYVATTRARDALILSATTDPATKPSAPALALIDQQFDRATGQLRVASGDGTPQPRVEVVGLAPTTVANANASAAPFAATRPARPRPPLLEVAKIIDAARVGRRSAPGRGEVAPLPTWVRLDPEAGLSPTLRRVDRLARLILRDPLGLDPASVPEVAARLGRLTDPVSPDTVVARAADRVRLWLDAPAGLLGDPTLSRSGPWDYRLDWPNPDGSDAPPVVFEGLGDLALHDPDGGITVVAVGPDATLSAAETLRSLFAAHALGEASGRPIVAVWWLSGGDPSATQRLASHDRPAVDLAVARWADEWRAALPGGAAT